MEKIILDCDPGHDDAVAILMAGIHPSIELLGITTVAGNQTLNKTTINALNVCQYLNIDVPVCSGMALPMVRKVQTIADDIHGESGLDGTTLPEAQYNVDARHAAELIIDIVMKEPAKTVTLVPIGPLTNIALAARLEPKIVERVKEVVLMGGGFHIGNIKPMAEFNIENDPEAAHIVFEEKWPIVMVGLDLTYQALATQDVKNTIASIDSDAGRFVTQVIARFSENYKKSKGFDAPPVHDACAVGYVIDPTVIETRKAPVHVECIGRYTAGMTVTDLRRTAPEDCHTSVAVKLDRERFWNLVVESLKNL